MSRRSQRPAPKPAPPHLAVAKQPATLADIARRHPGDFRAQAAEIRQALNGLSRAEDETLKRLDAIRREGAALVGALEAIEAQIVEPAKAEAG